MIMWSVKHSFLCNNFLREKLNSSSFVVFFFLGVCVENGKQSQEVMMYCCSNTLYLLNMQFEQLLVVIIYKKDIYNHVIGL